MCLDDQILNTYLDGELAEPWNTQVIEHLRYCVACSARLDQLKELHQRLSQVKLTDDEITPHREKVLKFIENNHINKRRAFKFMNRSFRVTVPMAMASAAASVVILTVALLVGNQAIEQPGEIIPQVSVPATGSVIQVRATENLSASQLLENFTLEEILQYLNSKGYEVEVKMKGIQPLTHGDIDSQVPPATDPQKSDDSEVDTVVSE